MCLLETPLDSSFPRAIAYRGLSGKLHCSQVSYLFSGPLLLTLKKMFFPKQGSVTFWSGSVST